MWTEPLKEFLGQPIDGSSLALFRFLFGAIMCGTTLKSCNTTIAYHTSFEFYFKYPLFEWVKAPGIWGMHLIVYTLIAAFACFSLGLFYHVSLLVALILYTYIFLLEKGLFNNHYYLIILFLFLFVFVDGAQVFALDNLLFGNENQSRQIPYWNVLIFQLQLLIVYTYGGINKITYDWLMRGEPMTILFSQFTPKTKWDWKMTSYCYSEAFASRASLLFKAKYSGLLFSWAGMIFDLFIIWLMLIPATLPYALPFFILFHLFNLWFFAIGVFPYLNFAAIFLFLSPEFSRKILQLMQGGV